MTKVIKLTPEQAVEALRAQSGDAFQTLVARNVKRLERNLREIGRKQTDIEESVDDMSELENHAEYEELTDAAHRYNAELAAFRGVMK